MGAKYGDFVTDEDEVASFNDTGDCVCDSSDVFNFGRFSKIFRCGNCGREFVCKDDSAIHPEQILSTECDGFVHFSENPDAFYLLSEQDLPVQDYIEFPEGTDEKWLWADDGLFIGMLLYRNELLRAMIIAEGFRHQGHGKAFLEAFFETLDESELEVMAFEETKAFFSSTPVPISFY